MRIRTFQPSFLCPLGLICSLAFFVSSQSPPRTTAFVDVSVVPMDSDRTLAHQTVLVRNGVIQSVSPVGEIDIPGGALVVEGKGRWLAPGLADMHTHIDDPADFPLLLASGVTTTLNMGGASAEYVGPIRRAIRQGRARGPEPLIALKIDGPGDPGGSGIVPATPTEARTVVRGARRDGYDYIKIYSRLQPDIFEAIMAEANRQRLPVVGHVVRSVGLERGLDRGQVMIAHVEEYLTVFNDGPPDDARIPELVRLSIAHGVTVTANVLGITLIAEQWGHPERVTAYLERPEALRMRSALRDKWRSAAYARLAGSYTAEAQFAQRLTAALHEAGVPIMVGTDTPDVPGVPPGASVLDEMDMLRQLGFSNYDTLAAATSVPGAFVARTLPRRQLFGRIAPWYRADLLLLDANPLASPATLRAPRGVMVRGHWLPVEAQN